MTDNWDAKIYSQFLEERTRPAKDLAAAIPNSFQPKLIYDLGCGPGNSTEVLKKRWNDATIIGIDASQNMVEKAKQNYPNLTFFIEDIGHFSSEKKIDLLFANASLQWLDKHEVLIPHLLSILPSNGILAIQMPNNFHSATHQVVIETLQSNPHWEKLINYLPYGILTQPKFNLTNYYDWLTKGSGKNIKCWETKYFQEMPNHSAFFDWISGTALRPILKKMNAEDQSAFAKAYIEIIEKKYSLQINGKVLLTFNRIFMIATKS